MALLITTRVASQPTAPDSPTEDAPGGVSLVRWLGVIWFAIAALLGVKRLGDNSFLTHLATGRLILGGHAPHVDPYSFTAGGRPWVVQSWLASVFDASVEKLGGLGVLRWVTGALMGLMVALIWRLTARGGDLMIRVAVTALATGAGIFWWGERPQMLAFVLMALMIVVTVERRSMWWLAPIFAVWVNVHASWPVGLALLAAIGFCETLARRTPGSGGLRRDVIDGTVSPVVVATCASVLGALVSPYGWSLLRFPLDMAQRSDTLRYIVEWQSPKLWSADTAALGVLLVLVGVGVWRRGHRSRLLLGGAVLAMAAVSARNVPVGALALVPFAAAGLEGWGSVGRPAPLSRRTLVVSAVLVLALAGGIVSVTPPHVNLDPYPAALVDQLAQRRWVATPGIQVVAPDYVGNFLEARFGADANAFIDDRAEVYPLSVIEDYVGLLKGRSDWRGTLDRYGADIVIWPVKERLTAELRAEPSWHRIGRANGFEAWCNRNSLIGC